MKRLFSTSCSDSTFSFATLVLRVGAGSLIMIRHGLDKLMHFAHMAPHFANPYHMGPTVSLAMVIFAELFCAAFVILGLFTRLACIPLIINLGTALFFAHHGDFYGQGELAGIYLI